VILLNPGPVTLSRRVREALGGPDICHREPEFAELQQSVRRRLREVYELDGDWYAVLISGSGTAAVEAMLCSLVPPGRELLVLEQGVYGERMSEIARIHKLGAHRIRTDWLDQIDLASVADYLESHPEVGHLAVVHHETTTGSLTQLEPLLELCERRGVQVLIDAVSSFGAEAIPFASKALMACAATANKCLHGVPGSSFVVVRRAELAQAEHTPRSLYLDLCASARVQEAGSTRFTPAIPSLYALSTALEELDEQGGWRQRHSSYSRLADQVASALPELGFAPLIPADRASVVLRSYRLPAGLDYTHLHDALKKRGFTIYAGQGPLSSKVVRISTMGDISDSDIQRLIGAFREISAEIYGGPE